MSKFLFNEPLMHSSFLNSNMQIGLERREGRIWLRPLQIRDFVPYPLRRLNRDRFEEMCGLLRHLAEQSKYASWHLYLGQTDPQWESVIEPAILRGETEALAHCCPSDAKEHLLPRPMLLGGCLKSSPITDRAHLQQMLPQNDGLFFVLHPEARDATVLLRARGKVHFLPIDDVITSGIEDDTADMLMSVSR